MPASPAASSAAKAREGLRSAPPIRNSVRIAFEFSPQSRKPAVVRLDDRGELVGGHAGEPLVLEAEERQPLRGRASGQAITPYLVDQGGLADPAHADHGADPTREVHRPGQPPPRPGGDLGAERVGDLLVQPGQEVGFAWPVHGAPILSLNEGDSKPLLSS